MTPNELRKVFNDHYDKNGIEKSFPSPYEVDAETFGLVCQEAFNRLEKQATEFYENPDITIIRIAIGPNNGIMFKGIELVIKK